MRALLVTLLAGPLALWTSMAAAQSPVGESFPIAEFTEGRQRGAVVATQQNLGFVVVWQSEGADGDGTAVRGRRFSPDGTALTSEFAVNEETAGNQYAPRVAADDTGNFVVTWIGPDGPNQGVFARLFDTEGAPQSKDLRIDAGRPLMHPAADVDRNGTGEFVVSWRDHELGVVDVLAATFDPSGGVLVAESVVNTTAAVQGSRGLAAGMLSDGGFVVAWVGEHDVEGVPTTDIFQQRLSRRGAPLGSEFQVSDAGLTIYRPSLLVDASDSFLVVWHTQLNLAWGAVNGRKTDALGSPGSIRLLGDVSESHLVSAVPSGEFVVVWKAYDCCWLGRRFDTSGQAVADFPVPDLDGPPTAQAHADGNTVSFLQIRSVGAGPDDDLVGQLFSGEVFSDGFESGDTGRWSTTVP